MKLKRMFSLLLLALGLIVANTANGKTPTMYDFDGTYKAFSRARGSICDIEDITSKHCYGLSRTTLFVCTIRAINSISGTLSCRNEYGVLVVILQIINKGKKMAWALDAEGMTYIENKITYSFNNRANNAFSGGQSYPLLSISYDTQTMSSSPFVIVKNKKGVSFTKGVFSMKGSVTGKLDPLGCYVNLYPSEPVSDCHPLDPYFYTQKFLYNDEITLSKIIN